MIFPIGGHYLKITMHTVSQRGKRSEHLFHAGALEHGCIYTKQLPLITKGDPKRCLEEKAFVTLRSFPVEIALKT